MFTPQWSDFTSLETRGCKSLQIQPHFFQRAQVDGSFGESFARRAVTRAAAFEWNLRAAL
jgi:hypothetical protein